MPGEDRWAVWQSGILSGQTRRKPGSRKRYILTRSGIRSRRNYLKGAPIYAQFRKCSVMPIYPQPKFTPISTGNTWRKCIERFIRGDEIGALKIIDFVFRQMDLYHISTHLFMSRRVASTLLSTYMCWLLTRVFEFTTCRLYKYNKVTLNDSVSIRVYSRYPRLIFNFVNIKNLLILYLRIVNFYHGYCS